MSKLTKSAKDDELRRRLGIRYHYIQEFISMEGFETAEGYALAINEYLTGLEMTETIITVDEIAERYRKSPATVAHKIRHYYEQIKVDDEYNKKGRFIRKRGKVRFIFELVTGTTTGVVESDLANLMANRYTQCRNMMKVMRYKLQPLIVPKSVWANITDSKNLVDTTEKWLKEEASFQNKKISEAIDEIEKRKKKLRVNKKALTKLRRMK